MRPTAASIGPPPMLWTIHGDPRPQQRPRASNFGKLGARMYVPRCKWRKHVGQGLKALEMPFFPTGVPVGVSLVFRVSRPKSHYGTGRNARALKPSAPRAPLTGYTGAARRTRIGDVDNYAKAVLDEMIGKCFEDDSQVVQLSAMKLYADDQAPGVTISIWKVA